MCVCVCVCVFSKVVGSVYINVMAHLSLSPQLGTWGILLGLRGRVVRICVREVSLTLLSYTHLILV